MIDRIDIPGVGAMRPLTDVDLWRLRKMRGPNRAIAPMAFGLGMSIKQYRRLTSEQQADARYAYSVLTSPGNVPSARSIC